MTVHHCRLSHRSLALASALTLGLASMLPSLSPAHGATLAGSPTLPGAGKPNTVSANTVTGWPGTGWLGTPPYQFPGNDGQPHSITWDKHSYIVDGQRLTIWSGELHYWRLPSPQHWRDIFQKMKAAGFNAVSLYFFWGYHQSAPGLPLDFSGIRDVDLLLRMAAEEGLYVIARPGPYINAEISMGGMPAWQTNSATTTRSDWEQQRTWLRSINHILARHQVTTGGGSVLLYQVENEEPNDSKPYENYLAHLVKVARADGITVPIFHNDPAPGKNWAYSTPRTGLNTYSYDEYPVLFDCAATRKELVDHGENVDRAFAAAHNSPHFIAEGQGGAFTAYGASFDPTTCADFVDGNFYRQWIALNNGNGVTAFNYYMLFGGTNWGWTGSPRNGFTSYDYGASITDGSRSTRQAVRAEGKRLLLPRLPPTRHDGQCLRPRPHSPMGRKDQGLPAGRCRDAPSLHVRPRLPIPGLPPGRLQRCHPHQIHHCTTPCRPHRPESHLPTRPSRRPTHSARPRCFTDPGGLHYRRLGSLLLHRPALLQRALGWPPLRGGDGYRRRPGRDRPPHPTPAPSEQPQHLRHLQLG